VTQAVWTKDSALLQLPHFTEATVKACEMVKDNKIATVKQYKDLPDEDRKGMEKFSADQKKDVLNYLNMFPDISVETKISVEDDEDDRVYEGDLCTIQVTITRNNLKDGEKAGLVHAPNFPFPRKEAWWVIVGQVKEGKIISIEKVGNPNKVVVHKIKFLAPPKGKYEFDLFVKSNAYVGVDQKLAIEMETLDNTTLPEYKVHADDAVLDDEPTLFEEMLNAHVEQDSDDEDDDDSDDEEDEAEVAPKSAAALKKEQLQKARQAADDDDDDDDDEGAVEVYADK
jgi:translocation protein SEC63